MHVLISRIEETATPGTVIPKPEAREDFAVKGWGRRRGQRALIYTIPNHKNQENPHEKGINESEWIKAFDQLMKAGELSSQWFKKNMTKCYEEGSCNFTTIGGIFLLLGEACYHKRGVYRRRDRAP